MTRALDVLAHIDELAAVDVTLVEQGGPLTFSGWRPCPVVEGEEIVLEWTRSELGLDVALVSIRIQYPIRRSRFGDWRADFVLVDDRPHLLRRIPPRYRTEWARRDHARPPTRDDIEQAAQESAYTRTDRLALVDAGEAVPDHVQRQFDTQARARGATDLAGARHLEWVRRQERALRSRLSERLGQLDDADAQARLLAQIERDIDTAA